MSGGIHNGFKSIPNDSCSLAGMLQRANSIYNILYAQGNFKSAIEYLDSVHQFVDSLKSLDGAGRIAEIEEKYNQRCKKEQDKFQFLLTASIGFAFVFLLILFFSAKNMRMKRRQLALLDEVAELNVKISTLHAMECTEADAVDAGCNDVACDSHKIIPLLQEKFRLSNEIFQTSPQSAILRRLNMTRGLGSENKNDVKSVRDAIIGRFSDCCMNLRQSYPAMTNDDCLFCVMSYCGCGKEVQSVAMAASDDALRRRKSRIKQKLPEALFLFFFG